MKYPCIIISTIVQIQSLDKAIGKRITRVNKEAEALRAMDGVPGFPEFYGVVDRDPVDALVVEYLGNTDTFRSYTCLDLIFHEGPPDITKEQVIQVGAFV